VGSLIPEMWSDTRWGECFNTAVMLCVSANTCGTFTDSFFRDNSVQTVGEHVMLCFTCMDTNKCMLHSGGSISGGKSSCLATGRLLVRSLGSAS